MKHKDHFDTRRNFLCRSACASLGVTSIVNTLAHLRLMQSAVAQSTPADYKAVVCLFLYGGNDSNNTLLPLDGAARANYEASRARPAGHWLNIPATGTNPTSGLPAALSLNAPSGGFGQTAAATQFGVHPYMTNTRDLFNSGDLAFVANVGTLVQPIPNQAAYASPGVPKPPQLFSHSDQQLQWQSSLPDRPFQNGWGGRAAELLTAANANPDGKVSMNISIAGQNSFQVGSSVVQYAVSTGGVTALAGYNNTNGPYGAAALSPHLTPYATTPPSYAANDQGKALKALDTITKLTRMQLGESERLYQHHLEEGYNEVMKRARDNETFVGDAIGSNTDTVTLAVNDAFDYAYGWAGGTATRPTLPDVANQLKMTIRLIRGRNFLGNKRQIFFVSMGGYDTHQNQVSDSGTNQNVGHNRLMGDLDKALKGFREAIAVISSAEGLTGQGLWNDVTLFTNSDFTRTLNPNGSVRESGTDHAWGGHQIVMGGAVNGQRIYGNFPTLAISSGLDVDISANSRGRWIPTLAVEQFGSDIAKWFMSSGSQYLPGITGADLATIFPNLARFQTVGSEIGFMDFSA